MKSWDVGDRRYEVVEGWGEVPDGWEWGQVGGVGVDDAGNVHVFTRADHPYRVFDPSGKLLDHWGEGLFNDAHGICIAPDGSLLFVERNGHAVLKFDPSGRHRLTLGNRGVPSDTGWTREIREPDVGSGEPGHTDAIVMINGVGYGGPPFHRPTDVTVASDGNIFVSDGYRNSRVHKFAPDGTLLKSWGEPGNAKDYRDTTNGPGIFHTVHGIWAHKGRIYASDRENNRIQIFDEDGNFITMWSGFGRPTKIYISPEEEIMYVAELNDRVSLVDLDGNVIGRMGAERSHEPGKFFGPHGIWRDAEESIYVTEVLDGQRIQKFVRVK